MRDLDLERRELCAQLLLGKLGRAEPGAPALDLGRRRLGRPCREFVLSTALLTARSERRLERACVRLHRGADLASALALGGGGVALLLRYVRALLSVAQLVTQPQHELMRAVRILVRRRERRTQPAILLEALLEALLHVHQSACERLCLHLGAHLRGQRARRAVEQPRAR